MLNKIYCMICNRHKLVEQDSKIDGVSHSICSRCNFCSEESPLYELVDNLTEEFLNDLRESIRDEFKHNIEWHGEEDSKVREFSPELVKIYNEELKKIKTESEIPKADKR